ncbi:unnamed protein product, partial [Meganyctiphanes norvegica]
QSSADPAQQQIWPSMGSSCCLWTFECTRTGLSCMNCTTAALCYGAGDTPFIAHCSYGEVCQSNGGYNAVCSDPIGDTWAGDCDCDTIGNNGYFTDPYDPSKYMFCIPPEPEQQLFFSCSEGHTFNMDTLTCSHMYPQQIDSTIDCSIHGVGLHTNDPTCQTYTQCHSELRQGRLLACHDGEAFDSSKLRCVPTCDLTPGGTCSKKC